MGGFQLLGVTNKAAKDIHAHLLVSKQFSFFWDKFPRVKMRDHIVV